MGAAEGSNFVIVAEARGQHNVVYRDAVPSMTWPGLVSGIRWRIASPVNMIEWK